MARWMMLISVLMSGGCAINAPAENHFALMMVSLDEGGQTRHIKYNRVTGEAWWSSGTT